MKNSDHIKGLWALLIVTLIAVGLWYGFISSPFHYPWQKFSELADSLQYTSHKAYTYNDSSFRSRPDRPFSRAQFKPLHIELNKADSLQLLRVYGIGPIFAHRILSYRNRLGGFINIEQLMEVKGIDREKFTQVYRNFYLDTARIVKISINFAPHHILTAHPYVTPSMAARIDKYRKSKGGFLNYKELIDNDILLPQEAHRVAPYLSFN